MPSISRLAYYLQISRFVQQTDTLSWTMHVFVNFSVFTTLWLLIHAPQIFKLSDLNPCVKQRTKHYVQDGHLMAEFLLAATKRREVKPFDDITFVYRSAMTTSRLLVRIAHFVSVLIEYKYSLRVIGQTTTILLAQISRSKSRLQWKNNLNANSEERCISKHVSTFPENPTKRQVSPLLLARVSRLLHFYYRDCSERSIS